MLIIKNKILAVIPARGGSKGVPRKNIKNLNGLPLIAYTIKSALASKYIDRLIVSTDDLEIANISSSFGAEIPYLRSKELSLDNSKTIDCILDLLFQLEKNESYIPDYVLLLQCTSPLRTTNDIDNSIEELLNSDFDSIISVCEAEVNPYWTNILKDGKLEYFLADGINIKKRQDLPKIYRYTGAIYLIKTESLKHEKTFEIENSTAYIMSPKKSIDIDTDFDFKLAEFILKDDLK